MVWLASPPVIGSPVVAAACVAIALLAASGRAATLRRVAGDSPQSRAHRRREAAERLGLSLSSLYRKIDELSIKME